MVYRKKPSDEQDELFSGTGKNKKKKSENQEKEDKNSESKSINTKQIQEVITNR